MTHALREVRQTFRASPMFATYVLVTLVLAGAIGVMTLLMPLLGSVAGMAHFTQPSHRVHDLTFGFLIATAVVGISAQLRRPAKNVAGMVMALVPFVALLLAGVFAADPGVILSAERVLIGAGTVMVAILHPAGRGLLRSLSVARINRILLALIAIAAIPLLVFASSNLGLQRSVADDHAAAGHYGFMAAFAFAVIGVGLLASLRPDGWRLAAWVAGLLPVLLGLVSLVYPDASSSLDVGWALVAVAWGAAFVAAAEVTRHPHPPEPQDDHREAFRQMRH